MPANPVELKNGSGVAVCAAAKANRFLLRPDEFPQTPLGAHADFGAVDFAPIMADPLTQLHRLPFNPAHTIRFCAFVNWSCPYGGQPHPD